jgi:outer membrane autotransporter protein
MSIPLYCNNVSGVEDCFELLEDEGFSDLDDLIDILDLQTASQLYHSYNQMQPANCDNFAYAQANVAERIRQIYTDHYFEERVISCPDSKRWRIWVAPFAEKVRQYGDGLLHGYKETFTGITGAIDYRKKDLWIFSAGFSYADANVKVAHVNTKGNLFTYAGTLGTCWSDKAYFMDLQFSFLYTPVHAHRTMKFEVKDDPAAGKVKFKAKHYDRMNQVMGHLGLGYDFKIKSGKKGAVNIYPFGNVDYLYIMQSGYREKGAGSLNLRVYGKQYDYLRPEGGLGIGYNHCFTHAELTFDVSAAYVLEFRLIGKDTSARFKKEDDCHFVVKGLNPENNVIAPDARLRLASHGVCLTFGYHGEFGQNFRENAAEAELRVAF